jgi:serine/threonine protein kinase
MIGKSISHFKILEQIGSGGMGVVYKAEDINLKRPVALKFLHPALYLDTKAVERFIYEAQTASSLNHPNICTIYEIDKTDQDQFFIVMAYLEGETLRQKINSGHLETRQIINLSIQIANALAAAHSKEIYHRDIKPENIIVTTDNQAKILDFGLAKIGNVNLTAEQSTLGTLAYMSPEQLRSEKVDQRTDIWSLGIMTYEMITSKLPFNSDNEQVLFYSILNEQPAELHDLPGMNRSELNRILHQAFQKNRDDRYLTMLDLENDLRGFQRHTKEQKVARMSVTPSISPDISWKKGKWTLIVLLIIVILSGFYYLNIIEPESAKIAVLPFKNSIDSETADYWIEEVTDEINTRLNLLPGLEVNHYVKKFVKNNPFMSARKRT